MQPSQQLQTKHLQQEPLSSDNINIQPINTPQFVQVASQSPGYQPESPILTQTYMPSQYTMEPPPSNNKIPGIASIRSNKPFSQRDIHSFPSKYNCNSLPINANGVPHPSKIYCVQCDKTITTDISHKSGKGTFIWCFILAFISPFCCTIPFCIQTCKDKIHKCPNCKKQKGRFQYYTC